MDALCFFSEITATKILKIFGQYSPNTQLRLTVLYKERLGASWTKSGAPRVSMFHHHSPFCRAEIVLSICPVLVDSALQDGFIILGNVSVVKGIFPSQGLQWMFGKLSSRSRPAECGCFSMIEDVLRIQFRHLQLIIKFMVIIRLYC